MPRILNLLGTSRIFKDHRYLSRFCQNGMDSMGGWGWFEVAVIIACQTSD